MGVLGYLIHAVNDGASDLFISAGGYISEKVDRQIRFISDERIYPQESEQLIRDLYQLACRPDYFTSRKRDSFPLSIADLARFRVNVFYQRGSLSASIRIIKFGIPDWKVMGIPMEVMSLAEERRGLVLVTGSAGSGKSVTQACLIDRINRTRDVHIITIENPIEYLHRNQKSLVSQQEVETDVEDTLTAISDCLQQSPDVIFLSEMRTPEIIREAITAAETGRLVIGTLYAPSAAAAVEYIIHSFSKEEQDGIRLRLSMVLRAVVSQQLLPDREGELIPAFALVRTNRAFQAAVREEKLEAIPETGAAVMTMDQSILAHYRKGEIDVSTVLEYAENPDILRANKTEDGT